MPRPEVFIWFSGASGSATAAVSKPSPSSPTTISRSSVEPPRVSMTRRILAVPVFDRVRKGFAERDPDPVLGVVLDAPHAADVFEHGLAELEVLVPAGEPQHLSLIHISEPTRLGMISYAVFC